MSIKIGKDAIMLIGPKQAVEEGKIQISQILKDMIQNTVSKFYDKYKEIEILFKIRDDPRLRHSFNLTIKYFKGPQDADHEEVKVQTEVEIVEDAPQWAYKVFKVDENYQTRTNKVNDFMDFDPDQNWQIEKHYQECCKSLKEFNTKFVVIGDSSGVKNGYQYAVWGKDSNPNNWYEKNTQLQQAPERQLDRRLVKMKRKDILIEKKRASALLSTGADIINKRGFLISGH